ncbi:hypothetical protein G6F60_005318 [Rhizopus arrhizus]|nr:hypothetical protein G6F60_005318 [Rhizopus arrhizus]
MNFEQYVGTHSEAYEDSSSDDEMDYEAPNFVYRNLIDFPDANSTITPEGNVIRDEKYGEANIAKFFTLITEGLSVPKAVKQTGIPRSTAYFCSKFEGLSISSSAVRNHIVNHCKISLKNVKPYKLERDSDRTIRLRFEFINAWKAIGVDYMKNCMFVDEAGFNSQQTGSRGWSKVDPLKPSDAEKIEKEFPLPDNKKKRKANVDDNAPKRKISKDTTAYHVVKFIEQTMNILDQQGKREVYIVMNNCRIHHSEFVKDFIKNRGYKPLFMPPYSPFLNPIEECWSKIKSQKGILIRVFGATTRTLFHEICRDVDRVEIYLVAFNLCVTQLCGSSDKGAIHIFNRSTATAQQQSRLSFYDYQHTNNESDFATSGKSSIQRVVFGKMPPNDTLYLESTTKIQKEDIARSFIDFQIWDFPGQIDFFDEMAYDPQDIFGTVGALIFVIDAQDDYSEALHRLFSTVTSAYRVNPNITFEVLIHKVDGLSDDYKIDTQRDVQQRMSDALADAQLEYIHLTYYLTSIYDNSIYEAFSKIIQKLIRELPALENLLNVLCSNSGIDKAYLFDTLTKIYIATDSSPVDMQSYELCSDMIDVCIDVECIYGVQGGSPMNLSLMDSSERQDSVNGLDSESIIEQQQQQQSTKQHETEASSLIKLDNGDVLYMREVNRLLVLICLLRQDNFEKHGLIDYNFQCFKEAVTEVFEFSRKRNTQQQ